MRASLLAGGTHQRDGAAGRKELREPGRRETAAAPVVFTVEQDMAYHSPFGRLLGDDEVAGRDLVTANGSRERPGVVLSWSWADRSLLRSAPARQ